MNFDDPSGHGILSWAKNAVSSAKNAISKAKTAVSKAVTTVKNAASKAWNTVKTAVSNGYNTVKNWAGSTSGSSKNSSTSSGSSSRSSGGSGSSSGSSSKNLYERAKDAGSSLWNWGKNKVKEAGNTMKSWSKTLEKTVQHFCTSAEYAKDTAVTFLKNVDWKKVAIGVGAAVAVAGVTVLTGGSAVPVLIGAAVGAGSGAVINGGMAALQGGSVEDIAKAASDGFMWGGIGGAFGGSSGQFLAKAATSGSKVMSNPIVQRGLEGAVDTTMETVETAASGGKVDFGTIATSLVINAAMSGDSGNTTKTVNQLMDGAKDFVETTSDSIRREVKETTQDTVNNSRSGLKMDLQIFAEKSGSKADVLAQNRANGRAFEQQEFAKFSSQNSKAVEQITVKTPSAVRTRVDAIGLDANGNVVINEYKSSLTAPLTDNQKIAFPEIFESGATVVGKGKGIFTGGYQIPPGTKVTTIRPE